MELGRQKRKDKERAIWECKEREWVEGIDVQEKWNKRQAAYNALFLLKKVTKKKIYDKRTKKRRIKVCDVLRKLEKWKKN